MGKKKDLYQGVKIDNAVFEAATKYQRKMIVADDIMTTLTSKLFVSDHGSYGTLYSTGRRLVRLSNGNCDISRAVQCTGCAKSAAVLSALRIRKYQFNSTEHRDGDIWELSDIAGERKSPISDVLSDKDWAMFEIMFEGYAARGDDEQIELHRKLGKESKQKVKFIKEVVSRGYDNTILYLAAQSIVKSGGRVHPKYMDLYSPVPEHVLALDGKTAESWATQLKKTVRDNRGNVMIHGICNISCPRISQRCPRPSTRS